MLILPYPRIFASDEVIRQQISEETIRQPSLSGIFKSLFPAGESGPTSGSEILTVRDLDDRTQRMAIQDVGDGITHVEHEHPQAAVRLIGTGATLVSGMGRTGHGSQRTFDVPDNLPQRDLLGGTREPIASVTAALSLDETAIAQLVHDLLEEFLGDVVGSGDFRDLQPLTAKSLPEPEANQGAEGILAFTGQLHPTASDEHQPIGSNQ